MRFIALVCAALGIVGVVAVPPAGAAGMGSISGTVTAADTGLGVGGIGVDVIGIRTRPGPTGPIDGPVVVGSTTTAPDGTYTVGGLDAAGPEGYYVCFDAFDGLSTRFESQCYDNDPGFAPFPDPIGFLQPSPGALALPFADDQVDTGIDAQLVRLAVPPVMSGRAFALSSSGLLKINPIGDTGPVAEIGDWTVNRCAVPLRVGLLLAARALCGNVSTLGPPVSGVSAGASVANVDLGLTGLPAVQLRSVSASSGTGCGGSNGITEIGFLKVGSKVLISNLVHPGPNTTINVLGIKLVLNEQVHTPNGLTVNAVHLRVGSLENLIVDSATTSITNC
jgi:hypothetical protein